jgi:hypothetical protein
MRVAAHLPRGVAVGLSSSVLLGLLAWAAPAAHAAEAAAPAAAAAAHITRPQTGTGYTWSKLTQTGSDTGIAATNVNGGLYYFWQAAGRPKWHQETVASPDTGPGYDYYTPAVVSVGSSGVGITAVDYYGNLDYWWQAAGTSTWTYDQVAAANDFQYTTPSIAVTSYGVVISAGYSFGDLVFFYEYWGNPRWNPEVVASQPCCSVTYSDSSIAVNSDGIGITDNVNGDIDYWFQPDNSSDWTEQQVTTSVAGTVSMAVYGDDMVITGAVPSAYSDANTVWYWTQVPGSGWVANTLSSDGVSEYTDPQISADSDSMIITASDGGGGVACWSAEGVGSQWVATQVVSGNRSTDDVNPSVVFTGSSAVVSAVNWDNGNLISWSQPFGSSTWAKRVVAAA